MTRACIATMGMAGLFIFGYPVHAQRCVDGNADLQGIVVRMQASSWEIRSKAFYNLIGCGLHKPSAGTFAPALKSLFQGYPDQESMVRVALIRLLETENRVANSGPFSEEYSDYYGDTIAAVAAINALAAEPRSLDALIGCIQTGNMAVNALAGLGDAALKRVLDLATAPQAITRASAIFVLERMLQPANIVRFGDSSAVRARIKAEFKRGVVDKDPAVRAVAAEGLGVVADQDVIPLLEALAAKDPACLAGQIADDGSGDLCPVRLAARRALASLRDKK